MGKLDNTLIIYIEGDNGTSAEGTMVGTPNEVASLQAITFPVAEQTRFYDVWGSDQTYPHFATPWSWAFDSPFKWMKQVASHFGGTRQGMAIAWPKRIKGASGMRNQFHHVIDIVPTILEATGIPAPSMVNGVTQRPIEGVSMVYTFDKEKADAPSQRTTQYFEIAGNRAIYHDGWLACTTPPAGPWMMGLAKMPEDVFGGYKWELYHIAEDYSEYNDLAATMPGKLRQLQEVFTAEAQKYNVFPLENKLASLFLLPRPNLVAGRDKFTYSGVVSGIPGSGSPNVLNRSYTITAEVEIPPGGGEGMLVTFGGCFGGYGLYLLKGKPVFLYNLLNMERFRWEGQDTVAPGNHTIVFDFEYNGPGLGKGGIGVLKVDSREVARNAIPHTIPILVTLDETFDVGMDTRTPVADDYQVPFHFTGKIARLTFKLGPQQLTENERKIMHAAIIRGKD
jgi:arylsulfatase